MQEERVNRAKLISALRYLMALEKARGRKLPETHYMKILWFFEGFSYLIKAKPSIGIKFTKHNYGPFSKTVRDTLKKLRQKPLSGEENHLEEWEVKLLSLLFTSLSSKPAKFVSEITHGSYYRAKKYGEKLSPLGILEYFVSEPTEEDKRWALEAYERYKRKTERKLF